jgi:hypothetical protein
MSARWDQIRGDNSNDLEQPADRQTRNWPIEVVHGYRW